MKKGRFVLMNIFVIFILITLTIGCTESDNKQNEEEDDEEAIILTVIYGNHQANYTFENIEATESFTGTGRYIKAKLLPDIVEIGDSHEYTGVRIKTLLEHVPNIPSNYNVSIISKDGWTVTYTIDEVYGDVDIYNEKGEIISNGTANMILAFKEDGKYYSEIESGDEIGPLRIAFVGEDVITSSSLWSKMVVSIEIISI